jgi:hypothetical protein
MTTQAADESDDSMSAVVVAANPEPELMPLSETGYDAGLFITTFAKKASRPTWPAPPSGSAEILESLERAESASASPSSGACQRFSAIAIFVVVASERKGVWVAAEDGKDPLSFVLAPIPKPKRPSSTTILARNRCTSGTAPYGGGSETPLILALSMPVRCRTPAGEESSMRARLGIERCSMEK